MIQQDVLRELSWDSRVDATEVGVEVDRGVVTLTGTVESYAKKRAAQEAAHRVAGVLDVADDIRIKLAGSLTRTDTEIAQAVRRALEWDAFVPDQKIRSTVAEGWVSLEGEVEFLRQREDAERVVKNLAGVRGVNNWIVVSPRVKADPKDLRRSIEEALERRAEREAQRIRVDVDNGTVTLTGPVHSWTEKTAILGAAGHAPGVRELKDRLRIERTF